MSFHSTYFIDNCFLFYNFLFLLFLLNFKFLCMYVCIFKFHSINLFNFQFRLLTNVCPSITSCCRASHEQFKTCILFFWNIYYMYVVCIFIIYLFIYIYAFMHRNMILLRRLVLLFFVKIHILIKFHSLLTYLKYLYY